MDWMGFVRWARWNDRRNGESLPFLGPQTWLIRSWSFGMVGSWKSGNTAIARGIPSCSSTDSSARIIRRRTWPNRPGPRACGSSLRTGRAWGVPSSWPAAGALDAVADVEDLAAALGLETFSVIGISGGTPYALAVLLRLTDRVRTATIISGMGPMLLPGALNGMERRRRLFLGAGSRYPATGASGVPDGR